MTYILLVIILLLLIKHTLTVRQQLQFHKWIKQAYIPKLKDLFEQDPVLLKKINEQCS